MSDWSETMYPRLMFLNKVVQMLACSAVGRIKRFTGVRRTNLSPSCLSLRSAGIITMVSPVLKQAKRRASPRSLQRRSDRAQCHLFLDHQRAAFPWDPKLCSQAPPRPPLHITTPVAGSEAPGEQDSAQSSPNPPPQHTPALSRQG